jgi:hypothetical protein
MATDNELDPKPGEDEAVIIPGDEPEPEQETETPELESEDAPEGEIQTEETVEEPEKPAEPEKPVEKKKISWELRRINEETNKRREVEKRAADLEAELARFRAGEKKPAAETDEPEAVDIEQIRKQTRDQIRQEEALNLATEKFNEACNQTFEKGKTLFGADFEHAADTMSKALGDEMQKRPEFLQVIVGELENGPQVYFELSKNLEEAERILKLPTAKMILEIGRMNDKVAKPAVKPISKAPAPVSPVGGTPKNTARLDDDDMPMDQFADLLLRKLAGAKQ